MLFSPKDDSFSGRTRYRVLYPLLIDLLPNGAWITDSTLGELMPTQTKTEIPTLTVGEAILVRGQVVEVEQF